MHIVRDETVLRAGTDIISNAKYMYFIAVLHMRSVLAVAGIRPEIKFQSLIHAYLAVHIGVGDCDKLILYGV